MKPLKYVYNGETYKYNKSAWYDERGLRVNVVIEKKLNFLAKDDIEKYDNIYKELIEAGRYLSYGQFKKAIEIYIKLEELELLVEALNKKKEAILRREEINLNRLLMYNLELKNCTDDLDAYINNIEHINEIERQCELGNYYEASTLVGKNERGILGLIDEIRPNYIRWGNTRNGCVYIEDYVPSRDIQYANDEEKATVNRVFALKDYYKTEDIDKSKAAVINIAVKFMDEINKCTRPKGINYLACVPCSNMNAKAPMSKVIEYICSMDSRYRDMSGLIKREHSVPESNKSAPGNRPSYNMQFSSLKCDCVLRLRENESIILLDDIVTTGTQMIACRDILIENGYSRSDIMMFAYAGTVSKRK